ncbi:hypothetical protein Q7P36_009680 [Cladosporium allicinum]
MGPRHHAHRDGTPGPSCIGAIAHNQLNEASSHVLAFPYQRRDAPAADYSGARTSILSSRQQPERSQRRYGLHNDSIDGLHSRANATTCSSPSSRRFRDALPNETSEYRFHHSQEILQQICQFSHDVTSLYPTEMSLSDLSSMPESNANSRGDGTHENRSERSSIVRSEFSEDEVHDVECEIRDQRSRCAIPRSRQLSEEVNYVSPSRRRMEVAPATRHRSSIPVEVGSSPEQHGHDCGPKSLSTTPDGSLVDDEGESLLVADDLSEHADDLPLSSQASAAIFKKAQTGLERLLLDLRSFDDDTETDLSVASGDDLDSGDITLESSGETSEPKDGCDGDQSEPCLGKGGQCGSREASGSSPQRTGAGGQDHDGPSRKRQRIDSDSDDRSRTTMKTKQKRLASDRGQMLICCFRGDSRSPCLGTDKSICEVIDRLASSHHVFICKRCYLLLTESESGQIVHPGGVDCVEHCLSPRCTENSSAIVGQKHLFNTKSCGTKTGRPRPEDRESIFRYIFNLVHPAKEVPANVFTTERTPHLAQELVEQFDELRKRDVANTKEIDALTRDGETKQTKITSLEEKVQRLQDIIADTLRPVALNDEHWHRSIRQRVKRDAPDALDDASTPSQHLRTPPGSFGGSQKSNTTPTLNDTGMTKQGQPASQSITPESIPGDQTRKATENGLLAISPHSYMYDVTTNPPSGPIMDALTERATPWIIPGSDGQSRQEMQNDVWNFPMTSIDDINWDDYL